MAITNLSQYYSQLGQRLPSVAERQSVAQQAGIQNYSGTAGQNAQLLGYLQNQTPTDTIDLSKVQGDLNIPKIPTYNTPTVNTPTTTTTQTYTPTPFTETGLGTERTAVQQEIYDIEQRMLNRTGARDKAIQDAGLYDDIKKLSELRSELTGSQNRGTAIPIQAKQDLRGRGATITEFDQKTAPDLEKNALEQLGYNTQVNSLSNALTTELSIIDDRLKQERERDEIIYKQKTDRLNQIESSYGNLLSTQQKTQLEIAKSSLEMDKATKDKFDKDKDYWRGVFNTNGDSETALKISNATTQDELNSIAYSSNNEVAQKSKNNSIRSASDIIKATDDLLKMKGLGAAVGSGLFSRGTGLGSSKSNFISSLDGYIEKLTVEELGRLKDRLGAVASIANSEGERAGLQASLLALGDRKKGDPIKIKEAEFVKLLEGIKTSRYLDIIEASTPATTFAQGNWNTASKEEIKRFAENLINTNNQKNYSSQELGFSNVGNDTNKVSSPVVNFIKQQEGFSPTAYRDGNGWSIGYGNQKHPDGTPVRQGDTIDKAQADNYLASALDKHSNWKNLVTVPLNQAQQAALASFEYNLGSGIWNGTTARNIINSINSGNLQQASQLMQQFNKSQGSTLAVLQKRRALEGQLLTNFT